MAAMRLSRAVSVDRALRLPLCLHGIQLGQPVDVLLRAADWRALGFLVRCGDGSERFAPFAAAKVRDHEIAVDSALVLVDELDFYRARTASFRELAGSAHRGGVLRDLLVEPSGAAVELVVDVDGAERRLEPDRRGQRAA